MLTSEDAARLLGVLVGIKMTNVTGVLGEREDAILSALREMAGGGAPDVDRPLVAGDVVQLKSGGPAMTIKGRWSVDPQDEKHGRAEPCSWWCMWAPNENDVRTACFDEVTLRIAPPAAPVASSSADGTGWAMSLDGEAPPDMVAPGYEATGPASKLLSIWQRPLRKVSP